MSLIYFTKLDFCLSLNIETPLCVIFDIAYNYRISINKDNTDERYILDIINTVKLSSLDNIYKIFCAFLNQDRSIKWKKGDLRKLNKYYFNLLNNIDKETPDNFGYATPTEPKKWSPAMIYGWLQRKGIKVPRNTSEDKLYSGVELYFKTTSQPQSIKQKKDNICMLLSELNEDNLNDVLLYLHIKQNKQNNNINKDKLKEISVNIKNLYTFNLVSSNEEAIVLSAIDFNKNIRYSNNYIKEYFSLSKKCFLDKTMKRISSLNPQAYDLDKVFDPELPINLYKNLYDFGAEYGIKTERESKTSLYRSLVSKSNQDMFFLNVRHNMKTFETLIDMVDIENDKIDSPVVVFGNYKDGYTPFLVSELNSLFLNNQEYLKTDNTCYTSGEIASLERIAKKNIRNNVDWGVCCDVIESVRKKITPDKLKIAFRGIITSYSKEQNKLAITFFNKVLKISYYMRGWKDNEPPPIKRVPTKPPGYATTKTCEYLGEFWEWYNSHKFLKQIGGLSLLINRNNNYIISFDDIFGLTIEDRLKIASGIINSETTNSCIRLSSNWLLSSAYFYLMCVGKQPNYSLNDYQIIS